MTTRSRRVLFGIMACAAWLVGAAVPTGAETLTYKSYVWMNKNESVVVDEETALRVSLAQRGGIYVCDTGEIATIQRVSLNETTKAMGTATIYETIKFPDGSTILLKGQSVRQQAGGQTTASEGTTEILKGTGRFAGIKGTGKYANKFLPADKGDAGNKQYGEGAITYTLPPK